MLHAAFGDAAISTRGIWVGKPFHGPFAKTGLLARALRERRGLAAALPDPGSQDHSRPDLGVKRVVKAAQRSTRKIPGAESASIFINAEKRRGAGAPGTSRSGTKSPGRLR